MPVLRTDAKTDETPSFPFPFLLSRYNNSGVIALQKVSLRSALK
jgi:hypothetical protein